MGNLCPNVPFKQMHPEERSFHYPSRETVKKPNSYEALPPSTSPHLLDRSQDLADLEDLVHLTVAREKRSESVQLGHNASNSPQVNGGAVSRRSEQHLRSSVPGRRAVLLKPAISTNTHTQTLFSDVNQEVAGWWSPGGDADWTKLTIELTHSQCRGVWSGSLWQVQNLLS